MPTRASGGADCYRQRKGREEGRQVGPFKTFKAQFSERKDSEVLSLCSE